MQHRAPVGPVRCLLSARLKYAGRWYFSIYDILPFAQPRLPIDAEFMIDCHKARRPAAAVLHRPIADDRAFHHAFAQLKWCRNFDPSTGLNATRQGNRVAETGPVVRAGLLSTAKPGFPS